MGIDSRDEDDMFQGQVQFEERFMKELIEMEISAEMVITLRDL